MMFDLLMVSGVAAGGFLMGLAGSLHCAGQCGGIASSLLMATSEGVSGRDRARMLLLTQLGRLVTYTLAGGVVGAAGGAWERIFDLAGLQPVLRLLGAVLLIWIGLALFGLVPGPRFLDRRLAAATAALGGRGAGLRRSRASSALILGMTWGGAPCGMVYNALLTAMLSGSPATGVLFMSSFGLATVPAVALTAFGTAQIASIGSTVRKAALRKGVGLAIIVLGLASMALPAATLTALCMG